LLIVDCCLLSAVVCICRCNCRRQHDIRQRFRHQRSLLCHASTVSTSSAALTFRPGGTSRGRGQGHHGQVLFGRERLKRSILVHILLNKEPSFAFGGNRNPQESSGILRNPEESGVNTGIPVPQEFLRKIPVKSEKNRNSCDLSKTTFLRKIPQENTGKKKSSGILSGTLFWVQKINS
jgi:hypothetical protein